MMEDDLYKRELQRLQRRMHEVLNDGKSDLWERRACSVVVLERLLMALHPSLTAEQQASVEAILSLHWQVW